LKLSTNAFLNPLSRRATARELDKIITVRGRPKRTVSENGTGGTSQAILAWSDREHVGWHHTRMPEIEVSGISAKHSRLQSSTTARMAEAPSIGHLIVHEVERPDREHASQMSHRFAASDGRHHFFPEDPSTRRCPHKSANSRFSFVFSSSSAPEVASPR
jgi:hypothetical protein